MILIRFPIFVLWYIWQVCVSTTAVLTDGLTPGQRSTPRVIRYPMISDRDIDVFVLSTLITLTPGTLTIGVADPDTSNHHDVEEPASSRRSADGGRQIVVHTMYDASEAEAMAGIEHMERAMLRGFNRGVAEDPREQGSIDDSNRTEVDP